MPPSGLLGSDEVSGFEAWVKGGANRSSCDASPLWDSGGTSGAECAVKSDCPGSLMCVRGVCTGDPSPVPVEAVDAGTDGAVLTYGDPRSADSWMTVDLVTLATASSYNGATFDGRYVYFAPDGTSGAALRYDAKASFIELASWSTYALTNQNASAFGYRGVAFDGRYVYFVPSTGAAILSRFDTHGSFGDGAAWTLLDLNPIGAKGGLQGATFDGRYLYLVPTSSSALRYDTTSELSAPASWSKLDTTTVDPGAYGYVGAAFDGRYVYYVPNAHGGVAHGKIARYDTKGPFEVTTSWSTFDLSTVSSSAVGFRSAAFDGRYLYLVPGWTAPTPAWSQSVMARLDTLAPFAVAASWTVFDTRGVDVHATGYNSATFDGRYLVFSPGYDAASAAYHGRALLYDTTAPVDTSSSWSRSDTTKWSSSYVNMRGAAFDGQYMYFAPRSGRALRLLRRTPTRIASFPLLGGSFY